MDTNDKKLVILQYTAAIIAALTSTGYGATLTWTSPALPYLTSDKPKIPLEAKQFDLISSLTNVGNLFGFMINPFLANRFGIKWSMLLYAIPQTISWLLLVESERFTVICIARFICGLGYSGSICVMTEYLLDISNLGNRGILFAINNFLLGLGNLLPILYGSYLSYQDMNIALMMTPIIFFVIFIFLPDSASFVDLNKRKEKEIKIGTKNFEQCPESDDNFIRRSSRIVGTKFTGNSVEFVTESGATLQNEADRNSRSRNPSGTDVEIKKEIVSKICTESSKGTGAKGSGGVDGENVTKAATKGVGIANTKRNQTNSKEQSKQKYSESLLKWGSIKKMPNLKETKLWELVSRPNNRRSITIIAFLSGADIFAGHFPLAAYLQQFLTHPGALLAPEKASLVLSFIRLVAIILSTQIVERIGKRNIILHCGIIGSISMLLVGIFFYLQSRNYDITAIAWFPICFITISEVSNAVSVGNTFFALQAELFDDQVKSLGISLTNILYMLMGFLALVKFQALIELLGVYVICWFFAACALLLPTVIFFITPETKGKSVDEIQEELKKRTSIEK